MKAISIKQPWASLIIEGIKDIENRTWPCPKKHIGKRVLIHASARHIKKISNLFSIEKFLSIPADIFKDIEDEHFANGVVVGSAEIVDCVVNHSSIWAEETIPEVWGIYENGMPIYNVPKKMKGVIYNWVLANPVKFETPIQAKGKLSFWESGIEICHICGQPLYAELMCTKCNK